MTGIPRPTHHNNKEKSPKSLLQLRLTLLRHDAVGFPKFTWGSVPTFHGFVRGAVFLACTYDGLRLKSTVPHNLRNYSSVLIGNDASRLGILSLLD